MALENIKQMTRPLSEGKKVASHDAPEDYLKRARESFIIEFPEFEDLWGEELDKEMEKKGWFSDEYASDPSPYDMSGWYDIYTDMQSNGELPGWMDSFDKGPNSFMQNLDVLDISPWDFVQRKGKKGTQMAMSDAPEDYLKRAVEQFIIDFPEFEDLPSEELYKEMEKKGYFSDRYAMSDPHPDAERADMMDIMSEKYFGKPYDKLTPKEIELLEENWDELISQTKQPKKSGLM